MEYGVVLCLLISAVLSTLFHFACEKPLLSLGAVANAVVIVCLFNACGFLSFHDFTREDDKYFDNAIKANEDNIVNVRGHCNSKIALPHTFPSLSKTIHTFKFPNGRGNITFLIMGNSYSVNQGDVIYNQIKEIGSTIYLAWAAACESLVTTVINAFPACSERPPPFAKLVEMLKPDVLLIVERGLTIKEAIVVNDLSNDPLMKTIRERVEMWERWTKQIWIAGAIPQLVHTPVTKAVEYLKERRKLIDSPSLVLYDHFPQRERLAAIPKLCSKCHIFEWEHVFVEDKFVFRPFNKSTDVMYFDDWLHLGKEGLEKMIPVYKKLADNITSAFSKHHPARTL